MPLGPPFFAEDDISDSPPPLLPTQLDVNPFATSTPRILPSGHPGHSPSAPSPERLSETPVARYRRQTTPSLTMIRGRRGAASLTPVAARSADLTGLHQTQSTDLTNVSFRHPSATPVPAPYIDEDLEPLVSRHSVEKLERVSIRGQQPEDPLPPPTPAPRLRPLPAARPMAPPRRADGRAAGRFEAMLMAAQEEIQVKPSRDGVWAGAGTGRLIWDSGVCIIGAGKHQIQVDGVNYRF